MKKALLVVSFGTSCRETRDKTIVAVEKDLCAAFPDRAFYRAWTSGFIRRKLQARDGFAIDSVQEAVDRMKREGVTDVLMQPTHLTDGGEFSVARGAILAEAGSFEKLAVGRPLLARRDDIRTLAKALEEVFSFVKKNEMLALMGHGSARTGPAPYTQLSDDLRRDAFGRFVVGTVEEEPGFAPVMAAAKKLQPAKVYLSPLLVVAGDHANNDMAGDDEDSWKSMLQGEGFSTECIMRGLGEYPQVRALFVRHAQEAVTEHC